MNEARFLKFQPLAKFPRKSFAEIIHAPHLSRLRDRGILHAPRSAESEPAVRAGIQESLYAACRGRSLRSGDRQGRQQSDCATLCEDRYAAKDDRVWRG